MKTPVRLFIFSITSLALLSGCFQNAQVESTGSSGFTFSPKFENQTSLTKNIMNTGVTVPLVGACPSLSTRVEISVDDGATWYTPGGGSDSDCSGDAQISLTLPSDLPAPLSNTWSTDYLNISGVDQKTFLVRALMNNIPMGTSSITITLGFANSPPVISASCTTSVVQDAAYNCSLNVSDPDVGDVTSWYMDGSSTCGWASLGAGIVSGTPNDDQVGSCLLKVYAQDSSLAASNNLSYNIQVTNAAPIFSVIADQAGTEETSLVVTATDVQTNEEGFGVYSFVSTITPQCSDNGAFSLDTASGAFTFIPNADYSGTCNAKIQFDDQNAAANSIVSTTFQIVIAATNDAPTLTSISPLSGATEDTVFNITYADLAAAADEADVDGDLLCFKAVALSTGTVTESSVAITLGSSTLCTGETWVWTPDANTYGLLPAFSVEADDGLLVSSTPILVSVNVTAVNDAPIVSSSCSWTATEGSLYSCTLAASDVEGDTLTWLADATNSCGFTAFATSTGTSNTVSGTPSNSDAGAGSCVLGFYVTDGALNSSSDIYSLTIANLAPTLSILDVSINEDDVAAVIRGDADVQASDEGDVGAVYTLNNATPTAPACDSNKFDPTSLTINSTTGEITFRPAANYYGTCYIYVEFNDGTGAPNATIADEFAVTVNPVNDPPVITSSSCPSAEQGFAYSCPLTATDVDGPAQIWTISSTTNCTGLVVSGSSLSGPLSSVGNCNFTLDVNDGAGGVDSITRSIYTTGTVAVLTSSGDIYSGFLALFSTDYSNPSVGSIFKLDQEQTNGTAIGTITSGGVYTFDGVNVPLTPGLDPRIVSITAKPDVGGEYWALLSYGRIVKVDITTGVLDFTAPCPFYLPAGYASGCDGYVRYQSISAANGDHLYVLDQEGQLFNTRDLSTPVKTLSPRVSQVVYY